ncbi:GFA family protein [Phenylobacterium sp.]|uniref:GFA family protein n=1 Tax=Phenylobacterium sp. TaxID=1871053 RepID=UPI003562D452
MTTINEGGCLCGDIRYLTIADPLTVTVCHCRFCQRFTGSAFLVEPIFRVEDVVLTGAAPKVFERRSDGSGKRVGLNFCARCGVTVFLRFERFPTVLGLCGGTFDNPDWFDRGPGTCRHIFTRLVQRGVALPPDVELYLDHVTEPDGTRNAPRVLSEASLVWG